MFKHIKTHVQLKRGVITCDVRLTIPYIKQKSYTYNYYKRLKRLQKYKNMKSLLLKL